MKARHVQLTLVEPHAKAGKNWTQPSKTRRKPDGYDWVVIVSLIALAVLAGLGVAA